MKRTIFIEKLEKETGYSKEMCSKINEVIETRLIIGKNNKKKIINDFSNLLDIDLEEANEVYNKCIMILGNELKNKIKHPFKSKK